MTFTHLTYEQQAALMAERRGCFFAGWPGAGPCDGEWIRAHLIPKQRIKRDRDTALARKRRLLPGERLTIVQERLLDLTLEAIVWDPRVWVPMCGGPMGNAGHHGKFDAGGVGKLVVPRAKLPAAVEEFAEQYGLGWSLERDYGPKET